MVDHGVHVTRLGTGPRVVLVHGSMGDGPSTFDGQRALGTRYALEMMDRRGFGRSPARPDRVDFDMDADDVLAVLGDGAHLVAHSYGAVASLVAAGRRPQVIRSLTVIEPPAFGIVPNSPAAGRLATRLRPLFPAPDGMSPGAFHAAFMRGLGLDVPDETPIPEADVSDVRASMTERFPGEAQPDLAAIRAANVPALVVRGGWAGTGAAQEIAGPAFAAVTERIALALGVGVAVFPEAAHNPQLTHADAFNAALLAFLERVDAAAAR